MPNLTSGRILVTPASRLSPTRNQFLDLSNAQPNLGLSPTTSTGYTLVSSATGTIFTNSLGNLAFNTGVITPNISSLNTITLIVSTSSGTISLITNLVSITGSMTFTNTVSSFINIGGRPSYRIPNYYEGSLPGYYKSNPPTTVFQNGDHWYNNTLSLIHI